MKSNKKLFFFLFFLTAVFISACKKKDTLVGQGVLNPDDYLNGITTDTFDLETYTIEEDSIITLEANQTIETDMNKTMQRADSVPQRNILSVPHT